MNLRGTPAWSALSLRSYRRAQMGIPSGVGDSHEVMGGRSRASAAATSTATGAGGTVEPRVAPGGGFATLAWIVLAYTVGVVLWGAYVRATGSGAGCGGHWPLCNGVVIPRNPQVSTIIELTHRASSGLALLFVVALAWWAFRAWPRGSRVRLAASLSLAFMVMEALLGAGLVLLGLVARNPSLTRAVAGALHLANTYLLLASLALTAWWAGGGEAIRWRRGRRMLALVAGIVGMILLSMTGAVAALGDTLFPSSSLHAALSSDFASTAHVLIRLRVLHPVLAVVVATMLLGAARLTARRGAGRHTIRLTTLLVGLVAIQVVIGVANLALLAPVWLQLVHLGLSDAVWITLVLLTASVMTRQGPEPTLAARRASA
jgi:cytochrome c oxidase assembly protein subunit 15